MKALILVAGRGTRISKHTENTPKTLLKVGGKPILQHIVDRVLANNVKDFVIIIGYQKEKIIEFLKTTYPEVNFKFIENEVYLKTNTLYSMWLAKDELMNHDFIYLHGDLIFNKNIIKNLLNPKYKNGAIVEPHKESMQVFGFDGIITKISKKKDAIGKALGIYKFSKDTTEKLFEESEKVIKSGNINSFQSEGINPTIVHNRMDLVDTSCMSWVEIDEEEDLLVAEKILEKILKEESE